MPLLLHLMIEPDTGLTQHINKILPSFFVHSFCENDTHPFDQKDSFTQPMGPLDMNLLTSYFDNLKYFSIIVKLNQTKIGGEKYNLKWCADHDAYSIWKFSKFSLIDLFPNLQSIDLIDDKLVWFYTLSKNQNKMIYSDHLSENEEDATEQEAMAHLGLPLSFTRKSQFRLDNLKRQDHKRGVYLFSKYFKGIKMDQNSWYDSTPESIAKYISSKLAYYPTFQNIETTSNLNYIYPTDTSNSKDLKVVIDLFCGVGGNLIQFCHDFDLVIAVDNDNERLKKAHANAKIYSVQKKVVFIHDYADSFLTSIISSKEKKLLFNNSYSSFSIDKIDWIFLSPPWGLDYKSKGHQLNLDQLEYPEFERTLKLCSQVASIGLCLYLPKIQNALEIILASLLLGSTHLEIEDLWIKNRSNTKATLFLIQTNHLRNYNENQQLEKIHTFSNFQLDKFISIGGQTFNSFDIIRNYYSDIPPDYILRLYGDFKKRQLFIDSLKVAIDHTRHHAILNYLFSFIKDNGVKSQHFQNFSLQAIFEAMFDESISLSNISSRTN